MKRAISLVATIATLASATAAHAAEHTILILPDAYFPAVTYVDPGDTIRFHNISGGEHNIIAKNNAWEIGPISHGGEHYMVMQQGVQNTFFDKDATDGDGAFLTQGNISFSDAPLD